MIRDQQLQIIYIRIKLAENRVSYDPSESSITHLSMLNEQLLALG